MLPPIAFVFTSDKLLTEATVCFNCENIYFFTNIRARKDPQIPF